MAHHRAYCCECGWTVKERGEDDFLDPFFLPSRCPGCHAKKRRHLGRFELSEKSGWLTSYGFWERDTPFDWLMPSTWFARARHWVDLDARRAQEGE